MQPKQLAALTRSTSFMQRVGDVLDSTFHWHGISSLATCQVSTYPPAMPRSLHKPTPTQRSCTSAFGTDLKGNGCKRGSNSVPQPACCSRTTIPARVLPKIGRASCREGGEAAGL